jgi:hypothetical protein
MTQQSQRGHAREIDRRKRNAIHMPGFDAAKEATKIESLAKDLIHRQYDTSIDETSKKAMAADKTALEKELTHIWKNPNELKKVTLELEKITDDIFSSQPNVSFDHDKKGNVTSMTFAPSRWTHDGLFIQDQEDHQIKVSFDKEIRKATLNETN